MRQPLVLLLIAASLAACVPMGGRGGPGESGRREATAGLGLLDQYQAQLLDAAGALHLTPTQLVLWDAYQERVGALLADQMKLPPYRETRQSAPQQIAGKVDTVRNRLAAMEDIQEAAAKLYAALDADQQKTADRLLPATVPALYSGLGGGGEPRGSGGDGERGGPGGGRGPGSPGGMGGMGGGFGRM